MTMDFTNSSKSQEKRSHYRQKAEARKHTVSGSDALVVFLLMTALLISVWIMEMFL